MAGFELRERIAAPAEELFALLTDPERIRTWVPQISDLRVEGGGPMGPGATLQETRTVMGKSYTAELKVRTYEPPHRYVVGNEVSGVESVYDYELTPVDGATDVRLVCTTSAQGPRKLVAAVAARMLKRQDGDQLAKLKAAAER